jgi:hypothetical protein
MDPMTAMMLVNAGLSVGQTAFGAIQANKAQKAMNGLERPNYQVNPEIYKSLGISQSLASNRNMPGQQDMEAQMDASAGNAVNAINRSGGSMADRMAAIAATYADNAQSKVNLGIQANQQYLQNLQGLQSQLQNVSTEKDKVFMDKQQAYYEQLARLQQQASAGTQNVAAGIQGLAGSANQAFSYKGQMNMLDKEHANEMARLDKIYGSLSETPDATKMATVADQSLNNTSNNPVYNTVKSSVSSNKAPNIAALQAALAAQGILTNDQLNILDQNKINRYNKWSQYNYGE